MKPGDYGWDFAGHALRDPTHASSSFDCPRSHRHERLLGDLLTQLRGVHVNTIVFNSAQEHYQWRDSILPKDRPATGLSLVLGLTPDRSGINGYLRVQLLGPYAEALTAFLEQCDRYRHPPSYLVRETVLKHHTPAALDAIWRLGGKQALFATIESLKHLVL